MLESQLNVKVNKLKLEKMQYAMSIWSVMMRDGKSTSTSNASLLVDQSPTKKFNAALELIKFFIGQSDYSLPAIAMAIFEKIPIKNPENFLKIGDSLREELKAILGKFDYVVENFYNFIFKEMMVF